MLFPKDPRITQLPAGLSYQPGLITPDEQQVLTQQFAQLPFAPFQFQQWQGKRRVVSYGFQYDYQQAQLLDAPPLPQLLLALRERCAALAHIAPGEFVQALVTEYSPGAGIGWHRDRPDFAVVCGVSLLTPCTLRLRRRTAAGFERRALHLEPGSAYVLRDEVRHKWEHSIAPLDALRYSVTFRTLTRAPASSRGRDRRAAPRERATGKRTAPE